LKFTRNQFNVAHQLIQNNGAFFLKKIIWILFFSFTAAAQAATDKLQNYTALNLLIWQAREGGADNWSKTITSPGAQQTAELHEAPFNWSAGVRLSVGHFISKESDVFISATHYNATATDQASGTVYSSLDANYFANNTNGANFGPSYQRANINWKIYYNTLDTEIGHYFSIDNILTLHPHFGLKFASINQDIKTNWYNPTTTNTFITASENLKNNFAGAGPMFGVDSLWPIYSGINQSFSLAGNFSTALVYGAWNFKDVYNNDQPTTITVNSNSIRGLSPMIDGLLGFQWTKKFPTSELSISLGYEEQIWFNQMQIYFLDTGKMNRSTTFQGGNLQIKLIY
jgi:hypothetical protein